LAPTKIDIISCILANILLDIQPFLVIFLGFDIPLHGISHTLLFAIIGGALVFYFYGFLVKKIFKVKKAISAFIWGGIIGGILHVLLDVFYHQDVQPFWPFSSANFAYLGLADTVLSISLFGYLTFFLVLLVRSIQKSKTAKTADKV
jgi:membrane-bound metal-dependent hydrolase YbcI (DUF457 family)